MSGPKVVRIVTREEILEICAGQLARVEAAFQDWLRVGRRNDCILQANIAAVEARLTRLRGLLAADRFVDLQKQAPQEVEFLNQDMQDRLAKVADTETKARAASRRQGEAAAALLAALRTSGAPLDADLDAALQRAADGQPDPRAMARGFALLASETPRDGAAQRDLAQSLKDGRPSLSLADWASAQSLPPDPVLSRFESRLVELSQLSDPQDVAAFEARLAAATAPDAAPRRSLLLDSLDLDLTKAIVVARKRDRGARDLRLALAELATLDPKAAEALGARSETDQAEQAQRLADVQALIAKTRAARAATARRAAVLESLSGLGYEVGEGLATAWAVDGRVVLRKAAQPDYGVEISGDPTAARMQMRVVSFDGEAIDPARDRDAEQQWCGDVATLQTRLAAIGGGLVIEKALAVGATSVKRIADAEALSRIAREGPKAQVRSLP
jgi:hypothetical protein